MDKPIKALLEFGPLTTLINMPKFKQVINVMHPAGLLEMTDREYKTVQAPTETKMIEFEFVHGQTLYGTTVHVYRYRGIK